MRRSATGQLALVFADNPCPEASGNGSGGAEASDASGAKAWLLQRANGKEASGADARATEPLDTARLLERAASVGNLSRALLNVARNKGAPGVDGRSVEEVVGSARRLVPRLRRSLLSGSYQPGAIRRVWIAKPGGGRRGLGIPNVVDRVVQQALLQVLEPVFEPMFHPSSHGFRPGRGAPTAIAQAQEYVREGYDHVVDIDLSKFFDRVLHQRLLNRLAQRIGDGRILRLVHQMLKARVAMADGVEVATREGTPQGGPLSPLLSNVVLDELDREMQRRGLRFVRYADDLMVFARSERAGHRIMDSLGRFIENRLRLVVNRDKSRVDRPERLHLLGFTLRRNKDGRVDVHLSARSKTRLAQRIRELTPRRWGGSFASCVDRLNVYLRGWYGYFRLCSGQGAANFEAIDGHVRRRLRMLIIRQKGRRPRFLFRHLRQHGVSARSAARTAFGRRGIWFQSATYAMHNAHGNAWFARRVFTLIRQWKHDHPDPTRACGQQLELFAT